MATAYERTKQLKREAEIAKAKDAKTEKDKSCFRQSEKNRMVSMIEKSLSSFGRRFCVEKKWFAGNDFWILCRGRGGQCLLSCVLYYDCGTWDASDDVRGLSYENWAVIVCSGVWGGPHDKRGWEGINTENGLTEKIAEIMKDQI